MSRPQCTSWSDFVARTCEKTNVRASTLDVKHGQQDRLRVADDATRVLRRWPDSWQRAAMEWRSLPRSPKSIRLHKQRRSLLCTGLSLSAPNYERCVLERRLDCAPSSPRADASQRTVPRRLPFRASLVALAGRTDHVGAPGNLGRPLPAGRSRHFWSAASRTIVERACNRASTIPGSGASEPSLSPRVRGGISEARLADARSNQGIHPGGVQSFD